MTIKDLAENLKGYESALIFCHHRPDGDTLSCAFALKKAYEILGAKADVVSVDGVPEKYASVGYFNDFMTEGVDGYGVYIAVDCAASDMLGKNERFFLKQKNTVVIDHHATNTRYGKVNYVETLASCSMNVYALIKEWSVAITKELAEIILLGLVTDTGNFEHSNTDSLALRTAAELIDYGADLTEINKKMFKSQTKARAELYIEVMSKARYYHDDRFAIIYTSKKMLDDRKLERADTEGFVDFPMTIGSVEVTAAIMESGKDAYKISLRSKNVNVAEIAQTFGGGGHKNASGFMLFGFFEDVIDKLVFTVGNYL